MFDWKQYITLAEKLYAESMVSINFECRLRNCVSRAYYGAFGETRKFCEGKGIFSSAGTADDHKNLVKACKSQKENKFKQVGSELDWLRLRRNCCDYHDDLNNHYLIKGQIVNIADTAIEKANTVCKLIVELQND
jgi:hypothetical protein